MDLDTCDADSASLPQADSLLEMLDLDEKAGAACVLLTPAIRARLREMAPGQVLKAALTHNPAAYLTGSEELREPMEYTPEMSRRARGVEVWAALRSLGRAGLADLVERCCQMAARFAEGLADAGYEILNEVVLNQVLVSFGTPAETQRVIQAVQQEGTLWCGGTVWQGRTAMRISVSSWATTEADVERCLETIVRLARG